jgi:ketosteroid isomerase-like protein
MSQENVEIVRGVYAAFTRRDNDAPFAVYAPDIEVDFREGGGPDAQAISRPSRLAGSRATLPDFNVELDEVRDLGDMTLVRGCLRGRGAASGASFERTYWGLFRWRDKRTVWWHAFQSEAEALEAARLAE